MFKRFFKRMLGIVLFCLFSFFLSGCNQGPHSSVEGLEDMITKDEDKLQDFANGHNQNIFQMAWWSNGYPFNCRWSTNSIEFKEDYMSMSLFKLDDTIYGGEYRTYRSFSYGYYSVCMKAIKCDGVITSFFTYTRSPWDEIDIEFLGNDTTSVQFNYYTNGKGNHEYHHKLGFDASEDFHEYGFYWTEDSITWYVDQKPIYRTTNDIPSHPQQIMMNVWNVHPDVRDWAGLFDDSNLPHSAQYKWIAYRSHIK